MKEPELDVEYDFVAVIDALPAIERQKHAISKDLITFLGQEGVPQELAECGNRGSVLDALDHFLIKGQDGMLFCLHIVCHGDKTGLWVKATKEEILWDDLRPSFLAINRALKGRLIVNMTSCEGLYGIKITSLQDSEQPFFGLIGPRREIGVDEAKELCWAFYNRMLGGEAINELIPAINNERGEEVLFNVSAQGYQDIAGQDARD